MGCDIHLHVEIKIHGRWEHYNHPDVSRNYRLFTRMAGVRESEGVEPLAMPARHPGGRHNDHAFRLRTMELRRTLSVVVERLGNSQYPHQCGGVDVPK